MPTYKFVHTRIITTHEDYWDEFDISDQDKWESVLKNASYSVDKSELKSFPKKAPSDPAIWFELYSLINEVDLGDQDEDRCEGIDHDYALYDEDGDLVDV
jgi:hypothetical protein